MFSNLEYNALKKYMLLIVKVRLCSFENINYKNGLYKVKDKNMWNTKKIKYLEALVYIKMRVIIQIINWYHKFRIHKT